MVYIRDFEGLYSATKEGRIFSHIKNRFLRPGKPDDYVSVRLCKEGAQYPTRVHRIIAETFIPNPGNLPDVNHINGIKNDNRVDNIEWCSRSHNIKHSYDVLGRPNVSKGDTHPKSKIIIDMETGIFYSCLREAAIAKSITRHALKGRIRNRKINMSYC